MNIEQPTIKLHFNLKRTNIRILEPVLSLLKIDFYAYEEQKRHQSRAELLGQPSSSLDLGNGGLRRAGHAPITDLELVFALLFIQVAVTVQIVQSPAFLPPSGSSPLGALIFFSFFVQYSGDVFATVACDGGDVFSSANS